MDELLNRCADQVDKCGSKWPGMSYEEGVEAGIRWLIGDRDDNPWESDEVDEVPGED